MDGNLNIYFREIKLALEVIFIVYLLFKLNFISIRKINKTLNFLKREFEAFGKIKVIFKYKLFIFALVILIVFWYISDKMILSDIWHNTLLVIGKIVVLYIVFKFVEILSKTVNKIREYTGDIYNKNKVIYAVLYLFMLHIFIGVLLHFRVFQMLDFNLVTPLLIVILYFYNMKILFAIIRDRDILKVNNQDKEVSIHAKLTIITAVILLFMILLDLFFATLWIHSTFENAYYFPVNFENIKLTLFYYTVISFSTIGYGDIYPLIPQSQILAMIISFTSVVCLVVFVGSIMGVSDDECQ